MRKYFFMIFATFFAGNLWAACQPTTNQLTKKSGAYHNEYLYKDTAERETRRVGGTGKAYLCGYEDRGGCQLGEKFAFEGAAVGNTDYTGLTVYTCAGGDENYYWTAVPVEEKCYSDEPVNGESVGEMTLYKVGYKYCEQVVYLKDVINGIVDNAIRSNNDTLLGQFWEELKTKIGDVYNSQEFKTAVVNVVNGMDKPLSDANVNTIIEMINKGIKDSGFAEEIGNIKTDIEGIKKRLSSLEGDVTELKTGLEKNTKDILNVAVQHEADVTEIKAEFEKVWEKLNAKMTKQDIGNFVTEKITELKTDLMAQINAQGGDLDNFKKDVKKIEDELRSTLSNYGIQIANLDSRITGLETRVGAIEGDVTKLKTDLEKNTKDILNVAVQHEADVTEIKAEFEKVWEKLNAKMTKEEIENFVNGQIAVLEGEIMQEIQKTNGNLEAFKKEVEKIEKVLQSQLDAFGVELTSLDKRIKALENAKAEIMSKLEILASTDTNLQSAINDLNEALENKVTMEQVLSTVATELANANLNENQKDQVIAIITQHTESLSDGQRRQVEIMIQEKIGKKFDELGAANQLQDAQRVSQDRVNSAMSVLNAFAAGQDASVWRNADGKFNTARLTSDATAGVILGTAGGLISNKIIKKNQIKKGFEGIGCYVGGQVVADYGDEFTVGMM